MIVLKFESDLFLPHYFGAFIYNAQVLNRMVAKSSYVFHGDRMARSVSFFNASWSVRDFLESLAGSWSAEVYEWGDVRHLNFKSVDHHPRTAVVLLNLTNDSYFVWQQSKGIALEEACCFRDAECGRLHCQHENEKLAFGDPSTVYTAYTGLRLSNGQDVACRVIWTKLVGNKKQPDPGMVPDGASCAADRVILRSLYSFLATSYLR